MAYQFKSGGGDRSDGGAEVLMVILILASVGFLVMGLLCFGMFMVMVASGGVSEKNGEATMQWLWLVD